ncbi:putative sulfate transporter [Actinorhabdospora filicis]|uniref:Sulfate transporter n=1 Tax=Actinorhabdospora filicis TaxID=1785913 RepID=A0A9W6SJ16_9ACTN|nr:putative sulfate transporter [Actinorhabdospora filicis]
MLSGLVTGLFSIPEGMAYASIAGFAPAQGLYAGMWPTMVGSLFSRTVLMVTTLTSAIALTANSALTDAGLDPRNLAQVATLTVLTGVVMALLGALRLGVVLSFVSNAVMTGFSTGIAVQILTGVFGDATGYDPQGHNKLRQIADWLIHVGDWDARVTAVALATVAVWALARLVRPIRAMATLAALLVVTVGVAVAGIGVPLVGDIATIPRGLPMPVWPDWSAAPELAAGAVSVALVALAQAAGISAAVPNPDGSRGDTDRDFTAQGLANLAGGFLRGLPVGGSLSRTGVAASAGAKTRWAGVFAGAWLALIVLTVGKYAEYIPMPVIGGLILVIGGELIAGRVPDIVLVFKTAWPSALALVATFLATTELPLQQAIVIGAILSLLLYCWQAARRGGLSALVRDGGGWRTAEPPATLPPGEVTVLDYTGAGFFAELPWLQQRIPALTGARDAVLILRMRGTPGLASTALLKALLGYAERLEARNCRLIIAGADPGTLRALDHGGLVEKLGPHGVYPARARVFGALDDAVVEAERWIRAASRPKQP